MTPHKTTTQRASKGIYQGILAYTLWGLLPVYWKALKGVPPAEIFSHRIIWSLGFLLTLMIANRRLGRFIRQIRSRAVLKHSLLSAALLATTWGGYIWAVNAGYVLQASLGYFISPILNFILGVVVLKERLSGLQLASVGLIALAGLIAMIFGGEFPFVGLFLGITFALYGFVRKRSILNSINGLTIESVLLLIPAAAYIIYLHLNGLGSMGRISLTVDLLLVLSGVVTAVPFLLFAAAARKLPFVTLGVIHYISPTLQFLLAVFIFKEELSFTRLISFSLVWTAAILYSYASIRIAKSKTV